MKQFKFILNHISNNKHKLLLLVFSGIMIVVFRLLTPLFFAYFVDTIIGLNESSNAMFNSLVTWIGGLDFVRDNLWLAGVLLLLFSIISGVFMIIRGYLNGVISEDVVKNIREEMFDHISKLPYEVFVKHKSGDLIQRCTSDIDLIRRFLASQMSEFVYATAMALISSFILFSIYPPLAWLSIISLPFIVGFAYFFFRKMQTAFKASDEAEAEMTTTIQENLNGVRVVKAFNREAHEMDKFTKKNGKFRDLTFRLIHLLAMYWSTSDLLCLLQIMVVVVAGVNYALAGDLSVGNYFVFVSYISMVLWPIRNLGRILSDMGKVSVAVTRLQEILIAPMEAIDEGTTPTIVGNIEFDHVGFRYDDGITDVLSDVSFTINSGETIAIMGPTGSGKSSLVALLTRLYKPTSGNITIDGIDLQGIAPKHIRKNISIVLQEPYLFSRSIFENIKIAHPNASQEQVEEVAKIANMDDVIQTFEKGYETLVGEKGVTLSGGQKQRLAIARSILAKAPILVFDDSLSAVDAQTDREIRTALLEVSQEVTTIIITHRINSAKEADRIVVIDQGRIVEEGNHQSLLDLGGLYASIAAIQEREDMS